MIAANLKSLFPGLEIVESHPFHVTRDAEVAIQELESDDLLESVEEAVWRRRFQPAGAAADATPTFPITSSKFWSRTSKSKREDVYRVQGRSIWRRLRQLPSLDRPESARRAVSSPGAAGPFRATPKKTCSP